MAGRNGRCAFTQTAVRSRAVRIPMIATVTSAFDQRENACLALIMARNLRTAVKDAERIGK